VKILRYLGHEKNGITVALVALMVILITTPFGLNGTAQSDDGYSAIQSAIDSTNNAKIAYLYSWNDRPRNPTFDFVASSDDELFSAASYGEQYFMDYLAQNGYTHVLVPEASAVSGEIFHKWGEKGTVRIALVAPNFTRVTSTSGGDDVVLYKINSMRVIHEHLKIISYRIDWMDSVRTAFYGVKETFKERGLHAYDYLISYEDGPSLSWVFQYSDYQPEVPAFSIHSADKSSRFTVSVSLVAAYGPNAPPQVIQMNVAGRNVHAEQLLAGSGVTISAEVKADEVVEIRGVLPCHQPRDFEPADQDIRRFCFGISDLRVIPIQN